MEKWARHYLRTFGVRIFFWEEKKWEGRNESYASPLFFRVGIFVSLSGPTSLPLPPSIISSLTVSPFSEDVGRYPHRHPVSLTPFPSPPFSDPFAGF